MYVRVYDPSGEPFDVTRERADRLILQEGWTQSKPVPAKEPTPEPAPLILGDADDDLPEEVTPAKPRTSRGRKTTRRKRD